MDVVLHWRRGLTGGFGLVLLMLFAAACTGSFEISDVPAAELRSTPEPIAVQLIEPTLEASCSTDGDVIDLDVVDGVVYFAGEFNAVIDADGVRHDRSAVAACTVDGAIVDGFTSPIEGLVRVVTYFDGRLLVGGNFTVPGAVNENVAALDARTGRLDPDFGPKIVTGSVHEIAISPTDAIYVAGSFGRIDDVPRNSIARFRPTGLLDTEFRPRLSRTEDEARVRVVYSVAETENRVYIGGDFGFLNGEPVPGIGAVDRETGRINAAFAPDVTDTNPLDDRVQIRRVVASDDWVYLCGDWWTTEGRGDKEEQRNFGRFNRTGEADASLEPWTDGGIRDCQLVGETLMTLGGHFDVVSGERWRKLVLVSLETGDVIQVMGADSNKGVQTVGFGEDGLLFVGGTFAKIKGVDQPGLAAIRIADSAPG